MNIPDKLRVYIESHPDLLTPDGYQELFDNCDTFYRGLLYNVLTSIGENPLLSMKSISNHMFYNSDINTLNIPANIEYTQHAAFGGCLTVTTITFNDTLKFLREHAFSSCTNLTHIRLSENIEYIPTCCFYSCWKLDNPHIPDKVRDIQESAFEDCRELKQVKLPPHLEIIEQHAFRGCKQLKEITIPKTVRYVDKQVFADCENITVYIENKDATKRWNPDWTEFAKNMQVVYLD